LSAKVVSETCSRIVTKYLSWLRRVRKHTLFRLSHFPLFPSPLLLSHSCFLNFCGLVGSHCTRPNGNGQQLSAFFRQLRPKHTIFLYNKYLHGMRCECVCENFPRFSLDGVNQMGDAAFALKGNCQRHLTRFSVMCEFPLSTFLPYLSVFPVPFSLNSFKLSVILYGTFLATFKLLNSITKSKLHS